MRRGVLLLPFLLLALVAGLASARGASAEGDAAPADALARLTPAEVEHVRRNVPAWDDLPEERRQRIAANVLRLRNLTPKERGVLLARLDRFRKEDATLRDRLPERLAKVEGGKPRDRFRVQAFLAGALGEALVRELPDDVRAALAPRDLATGSGQRGGQGGDARPLRPAVVGFAFTKAVLGRAAEEVAKSGDALRHEPSPDAPPEARARFDALKARVEAAGTPQRERETRALAWFVVEDRLRVALAPVVPKGPPAAGDRPAIDGAALVEAFRGAFPQAYGATWDEFVARARRSPDEVRRFLQHYSKGEGGKGGEGRVEGLRGGALSLVRFLEVAGPWLAADPEARAQADRLIESVLVRGLHMSPDALARLPGWDRPGERIRALRRLLLAREGGR